MNINNEYKVKLLQDRIYAVYKKEGGTKMLFWGTLPEVEAWISLKEKGFDI